MANNFLEALDDPADLIGGKGSGLLEGETTPKIDDIHRFQVHVGFPSKKTLTPKKTSLLVVNQ